MNDRNNVIMLTGRLIDEELQRDMGILVDDLRMCDYQRRRWEKAKATIIDHLTDVMLQSGTKDLQIAEGTSVSLTDKGTLSVNWGPVQ